MNPIAYLCLASALLLPAALPAQAQPPSTPFTLAGPLTTEKSAGPSWARNQPIYEVNLDKYGFAKGAALREFEKRLPELKELGVGIVWFMPLHPRGQKKGFGSPYSVRDYRAINADLGTEDEFRHLVARAHKLGMHVLMDWVPNHTAWDNGWIDTHPDFYVRNAQGEIMQAGPWADVAQLNFGTPGKWNQPLWNQMQDDMTYWLRLGVDGFRCDVAGRAGHVPREFWTWLRPRLDAVKPVFMLAEADDTYLHPAFDMTYGWNLPPVLWDVCAGRKPATAIDDALQSDARAFPPGAVRMHFLDNHDWHPHADWGWGNGQTVDTKNGLPQVAPLMVLCATLPGKPLLYNGQELSFLKTDPAREAGASQRSPVWPFYRALLHLYQSQPALADGTFAKLPTGNDSKVYAFARQRGANRVVVIVNLSGEPQTANVQSVSGAYRDGFTGKSATFGAHSALTLAPWGCQVYVQK